LAPAGAAAAGGAAGGLGSAPVAITSVEVFWSCDAHSLAFAPGHGVLEPRAHHTAFYALGQGTAAAIAAASA